MSVLRDIIDLHKPKDSIPVNEGRVKGVRFRYGRRTNKEEMLDNVVILNVRDTGKR